MDVFEHHIKNLLSDENLEKISKMSLGSRNFDSIVPELRSLRDVLETVDPVYQYLTNQNRNDAMANLSDLEAILNRVLVFDAGKLSDPASEFNALITQIPNARDRIMTALLPVTGMTLKNTDLSEIKKEGEEIVQNLRKIQGVERSIQGIEATSHASTFFENQAFRHGNNAKKYIWALVVIFVVAIIALGSWNLHSSGSVTNRIAYDLPALNIIALSWFAIRFISKNVATSQHLQELNQSKATVLRAGEQFGLSTDEEIERQVLMVVINSTMSISDPGYLGGENSVSPASNNAVANLVKAFTSKDS